MFRSFLSSGKLVKLSLHVSFLSTQLVTSFYPFNKKNYIFIVLTCSKKILFANLPTEDSENVSEALILFFFHMKF